MVTPAALAFSTLTPVNGASDVALDVTMITATFNGDVMMGSGNVSVINKTTNDTKTLAVTSADVMIHLDSMKVMLPDALVSGNEYYILIDVEHS